MSRRKRELSVEEKRLWRRVAEGLQTKKPLPELIEPAPDESKLPRPAVRMRETNAIKPSPRTITTAPLADRASEKRVRRGQVEIGATLDLHGHTQVSARVALHSFLSASHARGDRTVIVITGVGRAGEGVLRRHLPDWLADREVRTFISGYAQAHRTHGGAGAFYVFLKRAKH